MNNILSGLPDCIGAGETHWIIDSKKNPNQRGRCTECYNDDCPVKKVFRCKSAEMVELD